MAVLAQTAASKVRNARPEIQPGEDLLRAVTVLVRLLATTLAFPSQVGFGKFLRRLLEVLYVDIESGSQQVHAW